MKSIMKKLAKRGKGVLPILTLLCSFSAFLGNLNAQTSIPSVTPVTQNFDGMGVGTALPTNWRMHASTSTPTYSGAATSVTQTTTAGTGTTGGTYNFGNISTERAVGAMTSGSFASPNNLIGYYQNTNSNNLTDLTISYDAERYRINTAAASVQFFYSLNGTSWTAVTAGDIAAASFPTGSSTFTYTTPLVINKTGITISGLNLATNSDFYLRWNINTTGGSSQAITIDNISVTATFASGCTAPSTQASALLFSNPSQNGVNADWTLGNGDATLLVMRPTAQSAANPVSGTAYTADLNYTLAAQINTNNRVVYAGAGTSASISGLSPQTSYTATAYTFATVDNCFNITSAPTATGFTFSNPPTAQVGGITTSALSPTSIELNLSAATFPSSGATRGGYVVIYSTGTPSLSSTNGTAPTAGVGTIFVTASTILPTAPSTVISVTGLAPSTSYNFLVIPYTWDGTNTSTYNYLSAGAPTAVETTQSLSAPIVVNPTSTNIANTLATLGGEVMSDGGSPVTDRGIVWSLTSANASPTIGGAGCTQVSTSGTTGVFTINLTGLPTNSSISYVAYATNGVNTSYTSAQNFTTLSPATQLAFGTTPPATGSVGQNLTAFTVEARRVDNSVDTEFTGTIQLNQLSGSGSISGTTSVAAVAGIATFNAVQFNAVSTYTIDASASGLTNTPISGSIVVTIANDPIISWINSGASTTWHTSSNWSTSSVPSGAVFAKWDNTGTATTCAVNVNTGNPSVSGIEVSNLRTRDLAIGANVTTNGTFTLNGGYHNGDANTIIRHSSNNNLTFQPNVSSSGTLSVVLGNTTENIIRVEAAGNIIFTTTITGTNRNLTKAGAGAGTLVFSGNNTYSGYTKISTGTLRITAAERINDASALILDGGDFTSGLTTGFSETMGELNLNANSTIHLGTGNHTLSFSESSSVAWAGTSLTIYGWTGTAGATGTAGKIFVGTSATGLTAAQLSKITFDGFVGTAMQLATGEIVPFASGATASVLSGTASICVGASTDLSVAITGGTSPYTVIINDGTSNITVTNYLSNAPISVSPSVSTTYTLVSVEDAAANFGSGNSGSAVVTVLTPSVPTVPGAYSQTITIADGATENFVSGCDIIGTISDASGANILGSTEFIGNITSTPPGPNVDGFIFGRRKYSIIATNDGPATITLHFTQADFDSYNTNATDFLPLPSSGNNSDPNVAHFRIASVVGSNYTISPSLGSSLNWNGTTWEVTFPVANVNASYQFATMPACTGITVNNLQATNVTATTTVLTWDNLVTTPAFGWFTLRYREVGAPTWTSAGTSNNGTISKQITGLTPGVNYEAQIQRNCSSQSEGPWSASATFITLSTGCGAAITLNNAPTVGSTSVQLSWPSVSGASWFEFRYKATSSATWLSGGTVGGSATTKMIAGLVSSTSYDFQIRVFCTAGGASAWSATLTASTDAASACNSAPSLSTGSLSGTNVQLTWPAVTGAGWFSFRYKTVSSSTWISGGTASGTATSKMYSNLMPSTDYEFQARSFCPDGSGSNWSNSLFVTTTALAGCELAPVLSGSATATVSSLQISWTAVSGAAWYSFQYKESSSATWLNGGTIGASATSKTYTGLLAGTSYDFQVRTHCSNGSASAWSTIGTYTTVGGPATLMTNGSKADNQLEKAIATVSNETTVYPNPASDKVNIEIFMDAASDNTTIKLMDMSGRIVRELTTSTASGVNTLTLDIQDLTNGMYTLMIYQNGVFMTAQKVKKK